MTQKFDTKLFSKAIKQYRFVELNIGLREAAKKSKVSPATLSRLENEGVGDIDTVLKVCVWLKKPINDFIISSKK